MKLYDIPRNSKIKLPIQTPGKDLGEQMCIFGHIDGMYSYITTPDGHVVHLGATTPVKKVGDHYEIAE